jgi:hypothetical protein
LTEVQFRELDGKVGQMLFIFGDDFTLLAQPAVLVPTLGLPGIVALLLLLFVVGSWFTSSKYFGQATLG